MNQGTPTPRPRPAIETSELSRSLPNKESDYFTMKGKRQSASGTTLDDFSGWGGPAFKEQEKDPSLSQTPVTPGGGGGGFMGRLRQFGRSSKRPSSGDLTTTSGGSGVQQRSSTEIPDGTTKASHFQYSFCSALNYVFRRTKLMDPNRRPNSLDSLAR